MCLFDPTRGPAGRHTLWAYCHVPHGSPEDMTGAIESQIERFAPGFRDLILARHTRNSAEYEAYDANIVGGDIGGGAQKLSQFLTAPLPPLKPLTTPDKNPLLFAPPHPSRRGGARV